MGLDEFGDSFSEQLATESWTLYSIAICFIGLRTFVCSIQWQSFLANVCQSYARIHLKGVKGLAVDDYLMLVAAVCMSTLKNLYTAYTCRVSIQCSSFVSMSSPKVEVATSTLRNNTRHLPVTTSKRESRVQRLSSCQSRYFGSIRLVLCRTNNIQAMLNVIYTIKVCMLVFYTRLT